MFKTSPITIYFVIIMIAIAIAIAVWPQQTPTNLTLDVNDPILVERGKIVYAAECASCHGKNLEGQPNWRQRDENGKLPAPPHDETGHTWHHSASLLIDLTKRGPQAIAGLEYETDMPAYENILSDEDIVAVLTYIKSRWPENIQSRHDGLN